jgi:hypothetical protein
MDKVRDFLINIRWLFGPGIGVSSIVTIIGLVVFLNSKEPITGSIGFTGLVFCVFMMIITDAIEDRKKEQKVKA